MKHLQSLQLALCENLAEGCLQDLTESPFMQELVTLRLPFKKLSDPIVKEILKSLHLPKLKTVCLRVRKKDKAFMRAAQQLKEKGIELRSV